MCFDRSALPLLSADGEQMKITETKEPSTSRSQAVQESGFLGHTGPVGSPMTQLDAQRFDRQALLRWADDGGCWMEQLSYYRRCR